MAQGIEFERDKVLESLKPYLLLGYSINKACELAQFEPSTVYKWVEKDPTLSVKIKAWQGAVNAKARENIAKEINRGNIQQSNWWAERREKKQFSLRQELTGAEGKDLGVIAYPVKQEDEDPLEADKKTDSSAPS